MQRRDIQRIADEMLAEGANPSTIRNTIMPLRAIYRRALEDGDVAVNPTQKLRLPAVRGRRDRIASPVEAGSLLVALPDRAGLCGLARCTPASAEVSSSHSAGRTLTLQPVSSGCVAHGTFRKVRLSRRAKLARGRFRSLVYCATT